MREESGKGAESGGRTPGQDRAPSELEVLARAGRSLLEAKDLEEHLGTTLALATEALGASRGSVMMFDEASGTLRVMASRELPGEAKAAETALGEGIAGWVASHNEPVILHGGVMDERFFGVDPSIESSISLPLSVEGAVLGVLNISRKSGTKFDDRDLELASSLAGMAALALEKARLYSALTEREHRVSELLASLINAQEIERRRVAADIHDGFLQDLSAVFLTAESARMKLDRGDLAAVLEAITSIQDMIKEEVRAVREFIFEVRPPSLDQVGLAPTLRAMVERISEQESLTATFEHHGSKDRLPEAIETIIYRVAQEALRNVAKHAESKEIFVSLEQTPAQVILEVLDDGKGLDLPGAPLGHFGIETMRERVELAGGSFEISRRPGGGTEVRAVIPITSVEGNVANPQTGI